MNNQIVDTYNHIIFQHCFLDFINKFRVGRFAEERREALSECADTRKKYEQRNTHAEPTVNLNSC